MIKLYRRIAHFIGSNANEDDLILSQGEQEELLREEVWVLEKLDGVAVAISRVGSKKVAWEVRPQWQGALGGAMERAIDIYMLQRLEALKSLLKPGMVLYGEWCWHRLHTRYVRLPDLFMCYGLEDAKGRLLPIEQMWARCGGVGLSTSTPLWRGRLESVEALRGKVSLSQYGVERMEGLIVEKVKPSEVNSCGKWVEPDYEKVYADTLSGEKNELSEEAKGALWPRVRVC